MNHPNNLVKTISGVVLAAIAPLASAQTTVYAPDFSSVTLHETGGTYGTGDWVVVGSKNSLGSAVVGSTLKLEMAATTSGFAELQSRFTDTPVSLASNGDFAQLQFTFTGTGMLSSAVTNGTLNVGLYSTGGASPATDLANTGLVGSGKAGYETGFVQTWQGYLGRFGKVGGASDLLQTRPSQLSEVAGNTENQDLLFADAGTGAYDNPKGVSLTSPAATLSLSDATQYTVLFRLENSGGDIDISYDLYTGSTASGTPLASRTATASGANVVLSAVDGLAIGYRYAGTSALSNLTIESLAITTNGAPIPEPSSFALVSGLMGLAYVGSRRRRTSN